MMEPQSEMEMDTKLDGNAAAGVLQEIFQLDMAIQEAVRQGASTRTRQRLVQAFERELQTHQALIVSQAD